MQYYVYILTNTNNSVLYTGVTNDLVRRVHEHKNHMVKDSFTSRYNVEKLVYYEVTSNVDAALERKSRSKDGTEKERTNWSKAEILTGTTYTLLLHSWP